MTKQIWTIIERANEFIPNSDLFIRDDEFHYLANVLRLKVADEIAITNCSGVKALAKVEAITKKEAKLHILKVAIQKQARQRVRLFLALPKPSTLEEIVACVSEMGLDELHIFRTEKCASKAPVKIEKLERISQEAVRVSKSAFCTKIFVYENLFEKLEIENGVNLFCDESHVYENKPASPILKVLQEKYDAQKNVNIIIGPEASFTEEERIFIYKNFNCTAVSLGNNILRVPNAVYSALAVALAVAAI
ncbi:MAG: RsmE family RNA methyltransferase [Bdellovibrionota bacterium]